MKKRILGRTGLAVSELSFGGLFVASFAAELEVAKASVKRAVELGINYIDTAPTYGNSEEVVGHCLEGIERPLVVSTKLGGRPKSFDPHDRNCLMESVKESLRLLKRDHIDILMVHEPERPLQYDWWTDWQGPQGPVLEVLDELKKQGVIRFTGLGGTTTTELAYLVRTGKFDVVLTAYNYSLLWREAAIEVIPAAKSMNVGVIVGSPLQQGALAKPYRGLLDDPKVRWLSVPRREQLRALYDLAEEVGMSLPEMGLRFVLSNPDVGCVLMGARSVQEVEQNVAAAELGALPAELLKKLDDIAARVPFRPTGEPFGIGWLMNAPMNYRGMGVA